MKRQQGTSLLGKVVLLILALVFATSSTAVAALVNGGFETGDLTGWTEVGNEPGSWYVANFNPLSDTYHATTNAYRLDWQYIEQSITTEKDQWYTVSFGLNNGDNNENNEFVAQWNGQSMITLSNLPYTDPFYTIYSYTAMATAQQTTIKFGYMFNQGWFDLDNVSMNPVPIPGAIWLLGSGMLGLVALKRRFQR